MKDLTFSANARRALDEILEYISKDNPRAAVALVERIIDKCEKLASFPNSGTLDEGLGPGIRFTSVGMYVIYFRAFAEGVRIESVRHGARDAHDIYFGP
jgi:toxin ParE1/3/4